MERYFCWNDNIVSCIFSFLISYAYGNDAWHNCALFDIRSYFESYLGNNQIDYYERKVEIH